MKHVLVIGGAGHIGSALTRRLLATPGVGLVTVFDNFSSGKHAFLPAEERRLRIFPASIDMEKLHEAMRGSDTVFHLAANPDIAKAATQPDIDFWQGTFLTQCVLETMRETGVKRLFYTSGSGVYGDYGTTPVREDSPCQPISTYGASKLACEAMISAYCHMFGLTASVFRFANVVGPRQTHGVGYDFFHKLNRDPTRLVIMGDGTQSKSYVHVEDVLNAIFLVAEKQTTAYDVFNVSTPDWITVREIADLVIDLMGRFFTHPKLEFGKTARGWSGDVPIVRFNCEKIVRLGWVPQYSSQSAMHAALVAMLKETA